MKLSRKLTKKINCFSETYDGLKKAAKAVSEDISEMKELTEEGAELKVSNFSKKASVVARKFSAAVEGLKDHVEDAVVAADEVADVATAEAPDDASAEVKSFARKARILKREFAEVAKKFDEVAETVGTVLDAKDQKETTIKESVVPAAKELVQDADPEGTTTKVSGNPPSKELDPNAEAEAVEIKESVVANFSKTEFYKFSLGSALKAFGEFIDGLEGTGDIAAEVVYPIAEETAPVENVEEAPASTLCPVCGSDPCTCSQEAPAAESVVVSEQAAPSEESVVVTEEAAAPADELAQVDAEVEAEKNAVIDSAKEAIENNTPVNVDELSKTVDELDKKSPGVGEEIVTAIENFSKEKKESVKKNFSESHDFSKDQEILVTEGIKAFAANDTDKLDKVANFCQEMERMEAGKGQEVISVLENFASLYKLGFNTKKNFESEKDDFGVIGAVKELICFAADKMMSGEKWDKDEIAAKCEDLEQQAPGAGDIVVSTLENFEAIKQFCENSAKPETAEKVMADFSTELEKFVEEIPTADRTFAHKIKKACFEALECCDNGQCDKVAQFCKDVSTGLAEVQDEKLAKFCGTLKDFCGRFDAIAPAAQADAIPEEVAQRDVELNEVIDKMGEKGALLPANVASFAKKLCDSYKSMKCFTEEQLETKLNLVEGLKNDFCTCGVNFDEEAPASEENVETSEETSTEETSSESTEETPSEETTSEETTSEESTENAEETTSDETAEESTGEETASESTTEESTEGESGDESEETESAEVVTETEGDADYDPSALGDIAALKQEIKDEIKQELVEEEVIDDADKPSDSSVVVPVNFSETRESDSYGKVFDSIWDANC